VRRSQVPRQSNPSYATLVEAEVETWVEGKAWADD
jgi:hypothetical protein